jgi:hypothetical protein
VVLIHQNGLAQALARRAQEHGDTDGLLILTGHDHKQHIDLYGDVTVVDSGTAGTGGAFGVATMPVGVAPLHFAADGARLRAVDLVQVEPISGAAEAERGDPGITRRVRLRSCAMPRGSRGRLARAQRRRR